MTAFYDGTFTSGKQDGPRRPAWPFANGAAPDVYAATYDRDFTVHPVSGYAPTQAQRTTYTNYLLRSETFDNAAWITTNLNVSANNVANPGDGLVTGDALQETVAAGEHTLQQLITFTATTNTYSVYLKNGLRSWARLQIYDGAAVTFNGFFNVYTGQTGTVTANTTSAISYVGNGWYRCSITATTSAGAGYVYVTASTDGSTVSYAGTVASAIYAWGAQLERAAFAGAYVPTTSATASVSAPNIESLETLDGTDALAYLVYESPLSVSGGVGTFSRRHSRIPASQVSYPGSTYVMFPTLYNKYTSATSLTTVDTPSGLSLGAGYYLGGAAYTTNDYKLYRSKNITATTYGKATAGTFTITYGANTTAALNWNDTGATIKAAVDALASCVADGITTVWTNTLSTVGSMSVTITITGAIPASWPKLFTANVGSLTVNTSQHATTTVSTGNVQFIYLPDHHTIASHGFDTAKRLCVGVTSGRLICAPTGYWGSVDASTIWFATTGRSTVQASFAGDYTADIDATSARVVRTRITKSYSLPGVTVGITTPADIATSVGMQNPTDFYYALANTTGWQTFNTKGPVAWNDSMIYELETTEVNMADFY